MSTSAEIAALREATTAFFAALDVYATASAENDQLQAALSEAIAAALVAENTLAETRTDFIEAGRVLDAARKAARLLFPKPVGPPELVATGEKQVEESI